MIFFLQLQLQIKFTEFSAESLLYQEISSYRLELVLKSTIIKMQHELHPIILDILISNELD